MINEFGSDGMHKKLLMIGSGGHALSCIDVIELEGKYKIAGLVGFPNELGCEVCGYPIIGCDEALPSLLKTYHNAFIAVGQIKTATVRRRLFDQIINVGCQVPTIISPCAYVSPHAILGEGSIVMHGAIVNAGARIGRNCIINSKALVEHGVEVGDHVHLATSCVVNGDVKIGAGTFIGSGSHIRQSLSIGNDCVIGMGQIVLKDCIAGTCLPNLGLRKLNEDINHC